MARRIINTRFGQEVTYNGKKMIVIDVYPHIAYLKDLATDEIICVCLGDLVTAGIEPSVAPY